MSLYETEQQTYSVLKNHKGSTNNDLSLKSCNIKAYFCILCASFVLTVVSCSSSGGLCAGISLPEGLPGWLYGGQAPFLSCHRSGTGNIHRHLRCTELSGSQHRKHPERLYEFVQKRTKVMGRTRSRLHLLTAKGQGHNHHSEAQTSIVYTAQRKFGFNWVLTCPLGVQCESLGLFWVLFKGYIIYIQCPGNICYSLC